MASCDIYPANATRFVSRDAKGWIETYIVAVHFFLDVAGWGLVGNETRASEFYI